jgi:hypothetical protein
MRYPKLLQILENADRTIDRLSDSFKSNDYLSVSETMDTLVSRIETIQKIAIEEIPPDDVDKPKLVEIMELAFAVIANIKVAIDSKDQNELNANLYLLSLALDDVVEIIIAEGRTPD